CSVVMTLDKTIIEMELAAARTVHDSLMNGSPVSEDLKLAGLTTKWKYLMVVGINTAFSSRKRRDSIRETWMPYAQHPVAYLIGLLKQKTESMETSYSWNMLRVIWNCLLRQRPILFALALWIAEFHVKVDDDAHVNIDKSPSLHWLHEVWSCPCSKGLRYHAPEHWKFGEEGNKYFCHATGQIYAISRDLASYISINQHVLHKYANEDVSPGSWFIGLDVEHVDDRRLCFGTPPEKVFWLRWIVSGRHRQETSVFLHLTGDAVEFAILPRGSRKSISGVERVKMLCGVRASEKLFIEEDIDSCST
ncbi:Glycosyl transferase, family 31, partial [Dillenia turbinata]